MTIVTYCSGDLEWVMTPSKRPEGSSWGRQQSASLNGELKPIDELQASLSRIRDLIQTRSYHPSSDAIARALLRDSRAKEFLLREE